MLHDVVQYWFATSRTNRCTYSFLFHKQLSFSLFIAQYAISISYSICYSKYKLMHLFSVQVFREAVFLTTTASLVLLFSLFSPRLLRRRCSKKSSRQKSIFLQHYNALSLECLTFLFAIYLVCCASFMTAFWTKRCLSDL